MGWFVQYGIIFLHLEEPRTVQNKMEKQVYWYLGTCINRLVYYTVRTPLYTSNVDNKKMGGLPKKNINTRRRRFLNRESTVYFVYKKIQYDTAFSIYNTVPGRIPTW